MTDDCLKARMHNEARADAPEFSRLLHERIMTKVRAVEAQASREAVRPRGRRSYMWWGVAASVLVAVSLSIPFLKPGLFRQQAVVVKMPSPADISEPVDRILTSAAAPARETLSEGKYAYLDQDAKRLMFFLADQMPTAPTAGN